jgi:hypothetical protein
LFLKLRGFVQDLTEALSPAFENALPHPLEYRKSPGKPLTVPTDPDDHEFFGARHNISFGDGGFVLHEITLLQVGNLELELNLWKVVFGNVRLDLSTHGTLDFNQNSIFGDSVR